MKNYLTQNSKLKPDGIYSWGIPAYRSESGFITCPGAKDCIKGCYARNGFYVMPSVKAAQEERLSLSFSGQFVNTLDAEIKRRKIKRVRIHDSGDFYSRIYAIHWFMIAERNPKTAFYAYTKMVPMFENMRKLGHLIPCNMRLTYSEGGKWDNQINTLCMPHSRVFPNLKALKAAGYSDAHKRDIPALRGDIRVGLVYHGHKSKEWVTA